jgi:hypothetical protein
MEESEGRREITKVKRGREEEEEVKKKHEG